MNKNMIFVASVLACAIHVAAAPEYVPGKVIGGSDKLGPIAAIATGKAGTVMVASEGKITVFGTQDGKALRTIATGLDRVDALAFDGSQLCAFGNKMEVVEQEVKGRKVKRYNPTGVVFKKFSWEGQPAGEVKLEGAQSITHARIVGGKLYLADTSLQKVLVFDPATGKQLQAIGRNVRLCCGIFHFTVDASCGDVLIANLGAFSVQRYGADGKIRSEFGKRGETAETFHGCCNPVSAEVLPSGHILTAEKDPSRVKVYTTDGKLLHTFSNLKELVKGCSQVSVATDAKGNVYLGVNADRGKASFVQQYVPKQ